MNAKTWFLVQGPSTPFYVFKTNILESLEGQKGCTCLGINNLGMISIVDTPFGSLQQRLMTFLKFQNEYLGIFKLLHACMHLTL